MTHLEIIAIARKALQAIADCPQVDPVKHVRDVDGIAIDALIAIDHALEEVDAPATPSLVDAAIQSGRLIIIQA